MQKKQTNQKRKTKRSKSESDDEKPMKLRKRNQKQKYYESSQSDSDSPSPVRKGKQSKDKKSKETKDFKKGEYNHKIKDIPHVTKQLQGNHKENYDCCVRCANKELLRAFTIKNLKMFENILKSGKISDPFQKWAPDNNFTILHEIANCYDQKFFECFVKFMANKPKFAPETKFALRNVETGYNDRRAYGCNVRKVQVSRQGKQGNNAFIDDVFRESFWNEDVLIEILQQKTEIKFWQFLLKAQLVPKFVIDRIYLNIIAAVESGNVQVAEFLVGQIYKYPQYGYNIVHYNALSKNNIKQLGEIKKASAIKKNGDDILTPIHCAAINPNPQILEHLLEISQEYSILDANLRRPIHYAAACETSGTVELLIKKGVDTREGDNTKTTPFMLAACYGRLHNLKLLLKDGQIDTKNKFGNAAIHLAAKHGHLDCLKFLLDEDSNINLPGESRMTALHFAAAKNYYQIVQFLITREAKIHAKDKYGRSPLILAARNGSLTSLAYLLQHGADYNLPDSSKNSPLHYAAAYGFIECAELLIKAGADCNVINSWNLTPLSIALGKNHKKIVDYFLSLQQIDINCKDDKGRTLIANELLRKELNINQIQSLLKKKPDLNICDLKGNSPLHIAVQRDNSEEAIKLLLNENINVNIKNNNGKTAFISAICKGKFQNARIILSNPNFDRKSKDLDENNLLQQIIKCHVYLDQENGQKILDEIISTSSYEDLTNLNLQEQNANDTLVIAFTESIKVQYHSELKKRILEQLKINYENNKEKSDKEMDIENSQSLDDDDDENDDQDEDEGENDEEEQEEEQEEDDEQEEEESKPKKGKQQVKKQNKKKIKKIVKKQTKKQAKKSKMDEEDDNESEEGEDSEENQENNDGKNDQENKNYNDEDYLEEDKNEINEALLGQDDDDENLDEEQDEDEDKDKNKFTEVQILGKTYKVYDNSSTKFKKYNFMKYQTFKNIVINNKVEELTADEKLIQEKNQEVYLYYKEIEKYVVQLLKFKLPSNKQNPNLNEQGKKLIHLVYSTYPSQAFIQLFSNEIVLDKKGNSQFHYFVQNIQDHPLYSVDEMIQSLHDGYLAQNEEGDTIFAIAAKKYLFYRNVNWVNTKNVVPFFYQILQKDVDPRILDQIDPNFIDKTGRNALHYAIMMKNEKILQHLLQRGANNQQKDKYGRTPIFYAFMNENNLTNYNKKDPFELVVYITKDLDIVDIYGRTCLHYAAQRGCSMSARLLLQRNAKSNIADRWGNTPLGLAFLGEHLDTCITLIDNKSSVLEQLNVVDYADIISELTLTNQNDDDADDQEENVERRKRNDKNEDKDSDDTEDDNKNDETESNATYETFENQPRKRNYYNRYRRRFRNKDDEEKETQKLKYEPPMKVGQYSFYRMALKNGWPEVEYLLLASNYPLQQAIQDCFIENKYKRAANLLTKATQNEIKNANPNLWNLFAIYGKDKISKPIFDSIVNLLSCVSSQITDEQLRTPLHYACENQFSTLINYLLKHQININGKDYKGNTAFSLYLQSIKQLDLNIFQEWINSGCEINKPIKYKGILVPPLVFLTREKQFYTSSDNNANQNLLNLFLDNGCKVNDKDENGQTLLIAAIQQNNLKLIKQIWKNVDPKSQIDNHGRTPLHHVVLPIEFGTYDNIEMLKFLYPHFDSNKKDNQQKTILDYASSFDNCEIKTFIQNKEGNKALPRRAPTSVISTVDWPKESVDYLKDAQEFLNKEKKVEQISQVDGVSKDYFQNTKLYQNYSCLMVKVDVNAGYYRMNVFYKMQILEETNRGLYILFTRWGSCQSQGQYQHTPFRDAYDCVKEFKKIFKAKSGNEWGEQFVHQPKKYHLIKQKTHRNIQKFLKPFQSTVETKLNPDLKKLLKDFTDIQQYLDNLPDLEIEEDSLENLARDDLEHAEAILFQLEGVINQFKDAKEARELDLEELERLGSELASLSNKYYEYVPYVEKERSITVSPIVTEDSLNENFARVATLMNFEISTKIFLGALKQQNLINPLDYCLHALNLKILSLGSDEMEYKMIQAYAKQKIKAIYCIERKGEAQKFKKLANRYLLWHGTGTTNFIGILSLGLKIAPSWAGETGSRFGRGIYFADSLNKSIHYSDDNRYLLLCEVALGKYTELDNDKKEYDSKIKYQSVKSLGQHEPDINKCITIGNGCKVPVGDLLKVRPQAPDEFNEYIVYSEDQVRLRYLVQIDNSEELDIEK